MKFILFEIFIVLFMFKYEFADADAVRCQDSCEKGVDLSKIELAIKRVHCNGKVNLDGFRSATSTVRSLVCKCKDNGPYVPCTNKCVQLYNCDIIIPLVQVQIPLIVEGICKHVRKNTCEAIEIVIDNLANVYQSCIAGALSFQGDKTGGKQVEYYVDTCYNSTIDDLTKSLKRFNDENPGAGDKILSVVTEYMTPARNVYYGPVFRKCLGELAGQTVAICGCGYSCGSY